LNNECSSRERELLERFLDSYQDKDQLWLDLKFDESMGPCTKC
jgi:hypothetical protein